jgi:hypothetical protein
MSEKQKARMIAQMLQRALNNDDDEDSDDDDRPSRNKLSPEMTARVLKDMNDIAVRPNPFQVGDIVQIQKERNIYKLPGKRENHLAVVCEVFEINRGYPPRTADANAYCTNDMAILVQADVGWVQLLVDSWRFEKYDGEIAE